MKRATLRGRSRHYLRLDCYPRVVAAQRSMTPWVGCQPWLARLLLFFFFLLGIVSGIIATRSTQLPSLPAPFRRIAY